MPKKQSRDEREIKRLAELVNQVKAKRVEMAQTLYAIKARRRTPQQVHTVLDHAERARRRSMLLRLALGRALLVH